MNIRKIKEVSPNSFYPSPKVKSTILLFEPKKNFFQIKNPQNLEFVTSTFFIVCISSFLNTEIIAKE